MTLAGGWSLYTIRDIARLAGVSVATVSGVLNNKPTVKPALVARVKTAMDALDYHPDQVARSLRLRRTCTVGMVVADVRTLRIPFSRMLYVAPKERHKAMGILSSCAMRTKTRF